MWCNKNKGLVSNLTQASKELLGGRAKNCSASKILLGKSTGSVCLVLRKTLFQIANKVTFLLSPTGLLFIPGLIHDFGYRFNYSWEVDKTTECGYKKSFCHTEREPWDVLFHDVSNKVNGTKVISALAHIALTIGGGKAWRDNRKLNQEDIYPYKT
ncbi:hypothetical protein [Enterovibrio sp. 27052020O]|uniref:hypothetical protein n=1 Tax=Enterovibrio sp. 27052020O TaxID=3241166 RepID=UPI00388EB4BD